MQTPQPTQAAKRVTHRFYSRLRFSWRVLSLGGYAYRELTSVDRTRLGSQGVGGWPLKRTHLGNIDAAAITKSVERRLAWTADVAKRPRHMHMIAPSHPALRFTRWVRPSCLIHLTPRRAVRSWPG